MTPANEIISRNMKRIRQERNLTLDDLANLSGVSKSMLSEIERCTKSPTVSVLDRICNGIHVPLSQLTYVETPQISVVTKDNIKHFSAWEGFELFTLFEFDPDRKFEIFLHIISPHSERSSEYHEASIWEYIICTKGVFCVQVDGQTFELQQGEAIQFRANCSHSYINATDEEAHIVMLMYRG